MRCPQSIQNVLKAPFPKDLKRITNEGGVRASPGGKRGTEAKKKQQPQVTQPREMSVRVHTVMKLHARGSPLFGPYGDVPLDRVWFFGAGVYNLTCLCPKQGWYLS